MKAYTDIEQSKKLAEILPPESADMYYSDVPVREWIDKTDISKGTHVVFKSQIFAIENLRNHEIGEGDVYAWSLAALIELMGECRMERTPLDQSGMFTHSFADDYFNIRTYEEYDIVDAAVEMIIKLHELNLV